MFNSLERARRLHTNCETPATLSQVGLWSARGVVAWFSETLFLRRGLDSSKCGQCSLARRGVINHRMRIGFAKRHAGG